MKIITEILLTLVLISALAFLFATGMGKCFLVLFVVASCVILLSITLTVKWRRDGGAAEKLEDIPDGKYIIQGYLAAGNYVILERLHSRTSPKFYCCQVGRMKELPKGTAVKKEGGKLELALESEKKLG